MDRFQEGAVDIQTMPWCTWCYEAINDSVEYGGLCRGCYEANQDAEEIEEDDNDDQSKIYGC